jgi:hypothetical protein
MLKVPIATPTNIRLLMITAVLLAISSGQELSAETSAPVVRAVLFFSPTCTHCAKVREEVLTLLASPAILKKSAIRGKPLIRPRYDWLIPILALAGLGVAAYLSHVEVRQVEAVFCINPDWGSAKCNEFVACLPEPT